ncbi:hypothetical protein K439DRAFT_1614539 [Ramaria rubella]|nr:hypothetical protein K439DRAFT_1614539 [Ramaria rubella]
MTKPSNSLPSPPFALPHIDTPPCANTTSHAVIPHLDLWKPPNKRKLSTPANSTSCGSVPAGNPHLAHFSTAPSATPSTAAAPSAALSTAPPTVPSTAPPAALSTAPSTAYEEPPMVHLLEEVPTTPSHPHSHPPTFTTIPILGCTMPSTCLIISHVQLNYKTQLLGEHAFPEQSSLQCLFTHEAWESADDKHRHDNGMIITFSKDIECILQALAITMCESQGTNLIKLVPISYCSNNIILHKEPPFSHPILCQVINMLAFQGHPPIVSVAPNLFNPVPLPLIAFTCTLVHFALNHYGPRANSNRCMKYSADDYNPTFHPDLCATAQHKFWDEGRVAAKIPDDTLLDSIQVCGRLSEATLVTELKVQQPPVQPEPEPHFVPPQLLSLFS